MDIGQFLVWSRSPALPVSACPAWVADGASRPAKRLSRCFVRGTGPSPQNCRGDRRSFTFFKVPRDEAKFFISQRTNASEREREWCVCVGARRAGGAALPRARVVSDVTDCRERARRVGGGALASARVRRAEGGALTSARVRRVVGGGAHTAVRPAAAPSHVCVSSPFGEVAPSSPPVPCGRWEADAILYGRERSLFSASFGAAASSSQVP